MIFFLATAAAVAVVFVFLFVVDYFVNFYEWNDYGLRYGCVFTTGRLRYDGVR